MNRHGCKPTAEQDWRVPSGPTWLAGPTSTNLPAVDGCPPRPGPGPGAAPTRSPPRSPGALRGRAAPWWAAWPLVSVSVSFTPSGTVHRCSPRSCLRSSRTVADAGERGPALLESVLGASPREFESRILRHADLRQCAEQPRSSCLDTEICLSFCPRKSTKRRPGVRTPDKRAPWRSGLAVSVRDLPDTRQLTDLITLSDREVPGERAPSRRSARPRALA